MPSRTQSVAVAVRRSLGLHKVMIALYQVFFAHVQCLPAAEIQDAWSQVVAANPGRTLPTSWTAAPFVAFRAWMHRDISRKNAEVLLHCGNETAMTLYATAQGLAYVLYGATTTDQLQDKWPAPLLRFLKSFPHKGLRFVDRA